MTILPTAAEAIEEGQFKLEYFPNCANSAAMTSLIETRLNSANSQIKRQVGSTYTSTDADVQQELHDAVLFLACGRLWQIIINVMAGYDAEALPPEYVNVAETAPQTRDYYLQEAATIVSRNVADDTATPSAYVGSFTGSTTYGPEHHPGHVCEADCDAYDCDDD